MLQIHVQLGWAEGSKSPNQGHFLSLIFSRVNMNGGGMNERGNHGVEEINKQLRNLNLNNNITNNNNNNNYAKNNNNDGNNPQQKKFRVWFINSNM